MKLTIKDNLDPKKWDEFVSQNARDGGFLQSHGWGEFQESTGRRVYYLGVADEVGKIIAVALLVKHKLFLGMGYWYCPRGPIISKEAPDAREVFEFLAKEIKRISQKYAMLFWRLDPAWPKNHAEIFEQGGFKHIGQVQPAKTLILDLSLTEKELLAQMKSKTRYNIKVANKHGVEIVAGTENDFEEFWQMMASTALRDGIKAHFKGYYQKMLQMGGVKLALARWQGGPCAGAIMAYFGEWCLYLHGASNYEMRDKMAPYALQWQMIAEAQKRGCKYYDFCGVDEVKWPGVTRFKVGFAPEKPFTEFVGAYDFVYDKFWYFVYKVVRQFV